MLYNLGCSGKFKFHHDGFEFNDGTQPSLNFDIELRLRQYSSPSKVVYLDRDPRDVIVSLYYQVTGRFQDFFNYEGTISDFIRDDYFGAQNLKRFRNMWSELCQSPSVLHVSYEAFQADTVVELSRLAEFCNLDLTDSDLVAAAEIGKFSNMKALEKAGQFDEPWLQPRNGFPKVRKGKVGGFKEELSTEDIAYLDHLFSTV